MTQPPPIIYLSPDELKAWRDGLNLSKRQAAAALGVARNTYRAYEVGKYPVPRYIWLATMMISVNREAA